MNSDGILGLTWFALCSYRSAQFCRAGINQIRAPRGISVPKSVKPLFWSAVGFYHVLYLAGVVASISLFLYGSSWGCWIVGLVAGVELFTSVIVMTKARVRIIENCFVSTVSLISLVLLFSNGARRLLDIIREL